jgi:hypothetical protein
MEVLAPTPGRYGETLITSSGPVPNLCNSGFVESFGYEDDFPEEFRKNATNDIAAQKWFHPIERLACNMVAGR